MTESAKQAILNGLQEAHDAAVPFHPLAARISQLIIDVADMPADEEDGPVPNPYFEGEDVPLDPDDAFDSPVKDEFPGGW